MKFLVVVLLLLICGINILAQDLDFQTTNPIYTNGALANTYTNIGSPAVNAVVNITGNTNFVSQFGVATPRVVSNGLALQINQNNNTQCVTFTITFSAGVSNLSFNLYDIDKGSEVTSNNVGTGVFNYVDKVTITGGLYGATQNPSISSNAETSLAANVITGTASASSNINTISFPSFVDKVVIEYCNGPLTRSDPGSQGITIGDFSWTGPLPVKLLLFEATNVSNAVNISWQTSEEINNQYFEIQRSKDAIMFESIGRIAGFGDSDETKTYSFLDKNPLKGNVYYRLKQVDWSGGFEFSKIITANYNSESPPNLLTLYPNPSVGELKVYFLEETKIKSIKISNIMGNIIMEPTLIDNKINLNTLPQGQYVVLIETSDKSYKKPIIKE